MVVQQRPIFGVAARLRTERGRTCTRTGQMAAARAVTSGPPGTARTRCVRPPILVLDRRALVAAGSATSVARTMPLALQRRSLSLDT
jgi:hypothetical protein